MLKKRSEFTELPAGCSCRPHSKSFPRVYFVISCRLQYFCLGPRIDFNFQTASRFHIWPLVAFVGEQVLTECSICTHLTILLGNICKCIIRHMVN